MKIHAISIMEEEGYTSCGRVLNANGGSARPLRVVDVDLYRLPTVDRPAGMDHPPDKYRCAG
jgi:hypothetical protein